MHTCYNNGAMSDDCIFCKIVHKDIDAQVVYEDDEILAFSDINPQAPVHIVFIPKKHIETFNDISSRDADLMARLMIKVKEVALEKGISKEGYRVVANCNRGAGQEVFHLHVHLLGGRSFTWPPG